MTKSELLAKYKPNQGNDPLDKECGRRIIELIRKRGMKHKDAVEQLGWTTTTLYAYTSGRKRLRINRFAQLVDGLQLTQSEMFQLLEVYMEEDDG